MAGKKYGHFDDANREYVITDPKTPWPWINYLGNEDFFSLISNTAGGYSFYKDAKFRRITRYRYNGVPMDNGGRYFYIKDGDVAGLSAFQGDAALLSIVKEGKKLFVVGTKESVALTEKEKMIIVFRRTRFSPCLDLRW